MVKALLVSPASTLCIKFSGEQGVNTSTVSREFLELTIESTRKESFLNGAPQMSTCQIKRHIQNLWRDSSSRTYMTWFAPLFPKPMLLSCFTQRIWFDGYHDIIVTGLTAGEHEKMSTIGANFKENFDFHT